MALISFREPQRETSVISMSLSRVENFWLLICCHASVSYEVAFSLSSQRIRIVLVCRWFFVTCCLLLRPLAAILKLKKYLLPDSSLFAFTLTWFWFCCFLFDFASAIYNNLTVIQQYTPVLSPLHFYNLFFLFFLIPNSSFHCILVHLRSFICSANHVNVGTCFLNWL